MASGPIGRLRQAERRQVMLLREHDVSVCAQQQGLQRPPRRGVRRNDTQREALRAVGLIGVMSRGAGTPETDGLGVAVLCTLCPAPTTCVGPRCISLAEAASGFHSVCPRFPSLAIPAIVDRGRGSACASSGAGLVMSALLALEVLVVPALRRVRGAVPCSALCVSSAPRWLTHLITMYLALVTDSSKSCHHSSPTIAARSRVLCLVGLASMSPEASASARGREATQYNNLRLTSACLPLASMPKVLSLPAPAAPLAVPPAGDPTAR
jgi:hypothetical protein